MGRRSLPFPAPWNSSMPHPSAQRLSSMTLAFLLLCAGGARADGCPQEKAIYGDRDKAYELRFSEVGSHSAAASNQFKLVVLNTSTVLDGVVMPSDEPLRSNGVLMFNCPKGDVTGADLRACIIWQGPIYSVAADGAIGTLPAEGEGAAQQVLLAALGPAIRQSSVFGKGKARVAPWDVFTLKGCGT
jgi:hypothetical protein